MYAAGKLGATLRELARVKAEHVKERAAWAKKEAERSKLALSQSNPTDRTTLSKNLNFLSKSVLKCTNPRLFMPSTVLLGWMFTLEYRFRKEI